MREVYLKYIVALVAIVGIVAMELVAMIVLQINGQLLLSVVGVVGGIAGWAYGVKGKVPVTELTQMAGAAVQNAATTYLMPDWVACPGCDTRYSKEQMGLTGNLPGALVDVTCANPECGITFGLGREQLGIGG